MGSKLTVKQIQDMMPSLEVTMEPVGRLAEYANNAKEHTAEQIGQIKASMRQVGFCDPIGVWTNPEGKSEVVEGHGRLAAALELGLESVPVIHLDGLTDEQRRFYALVHNQLTMSTGWDFSKLDAELESLGGHRHGRVRVRGAVRRSAGPLGRRLRFPQGRGRPRVLQHHVHLPG